MDIFNIIFRNIGTAIKGIFEDEMITFALKIAFITIPILIYIIIKKEKNNIKNLNENKYKEWKVEYTDIKKQSQLNNYQPIHQYLPYRLVTPILTQREKKAYFIINSYCIKNNLALFSKIRLADFITPKNTIHNKDFYFWFNKISAKHVDFLIVQQGSFIPLLAIEVDDPTHYRADRQERDILVDNIYFSVGLPIIHIWDLSAEKIESEINNVLTTVIR